MSEAEATPLPRKRRWFAFSLRTLFVMMTVACCMGYQLNWIRQRHSFASKHAAIGSASGHRGGLSSGWGQKQRVAPGLLWFFGEPAAARICPLIVIDQYDGSSLMDHEEIQLARRLFPEADVTPMYVLRSELSK